MILRNSALRHAAPFRRTCLRALSTSTSTTQQSPLPTATAVADPPSEAEPATAAPPPAPVKPIWNPSGREELDNRPAEQFKVAEAIKKSTGHLGGRVRERFNPSSLLNDPPYPEDVTLELLMASQTHMGHHRSLWNPQNQRYIYGIRQGIHIISLEETAAALRRAAKIVEEVAFLGGLMLFVGNREGQMEITARAAQLAGACHLYTKWTPGTITNRDQILGKEEIHIVDQMDRPIAGFDKHLLERRPLLPDLVVVLNPLENFTLLHECIQENIPTIGLVDTNADPTKLTYIIPGNDDSLRSVSVIAGVLGRAGERGRKRRIQNAQQGLCTWENPADVQNFIMDQIRSHAEEQAAAKEGEAEDGDATNKDKFDAEAIAAELAGTKS